MNQANEIPPFRGDLSPEETANWLQTLVAATGSFSDAGIFRLLSTKFVNGSPAGEWLDGLDDEKKTSWTHFERSFRARWITAPQLQAREDGKWDEFCKHKLSYDRIFAHDLPDPTQSRAVAVSWVDDHYHLGEDINRDKEALIRATASLLPTFMQAYLETYVTSASTSFLAYCNAIEEIPTEAYQFEWLCQQKSLKSIRSLETQIQEISIKVDRILEVQGNSSTRIDGVATPRHQPPPGATDNGFDGSVAWEPSSPLTTVMSVDGLSEVITPKVEQRSLPDVAEATGEVVASRPQEDTSLPIPQHWRKPVTSLSKVDRIAIADKCIEFVLNYESVISNNQAAYMNTAIIVFDQLTNRPSRNRDSRTMLPPDRQPEELWYLIESVHRYRTAKQPSTLHFCQEEWSKFIPTNAIVKYERLGFVNLKQTVYGASWCDSKTAFGVQPSGEATLLGGFRVIESVNWPDKVKVWSYKTVLFMTLSSYLAECTNDPGILELAILCATCIKKHMYDSKTSLIKDCYIPDYNSVGSTVSCHLTGMTIEGFSVLATVSGNGAWNRLAVDLAEAAMHSKEWHSSEGILTVGCDDTPYVNIDTKAFKGSLNRGLLVAYQRNPHDKPLRHSIRSYVNVQFNALLDLSSRRNSYGVDWRGPYVGPYLHAQLAALDTLIAAIGVND